MEYDLHELISGLEYYRFDKYPENALYKNQIITRVKEVRDQLKICCDNYNGSTSAQICHLNMGMTHNMLDTTVISSMRRDIIKIMSSIEVGKKIVESGKMVVLVTKTKHMDNNTVVSVIVIVFPDSLNMQIDNILYPMHTHLSPATHEILVLLPKGEAKEFMNKFRKHVQNIKQDIVFIANKLDPSLLAMSGVSPETNSNIKKLLDTLYINNLQLIDTNDSFDFMEIDYLYISGTTKLIRTYSNTDEMHPREEGVEN